MPPRGVLRGIPTLPTRWRTPELDEIENRFFTIVWDGRGEGDHNGIFARSYNLLTDNFDREMLVNTYTSGAPIVTRNCRFF